MPSPALLIVEDSAEDAALITAALRGAVPPEQITVCGTGEAALDFLHLRGEHAGRPAYELPALVLLDLGLPGMSGFEVLRALRASPRTRLLPVIVLSASVEQVDVRRAMLLGASSYIRKSLDAVRLTENLELLARYWLGLNVPPPVPNHKH
ncbi:MAG: response regulator [Thermomicrobiales bacterium]|jgi:two-component system response regulator|nr:MAG: response regulator [Thermomicrobiales bacterium]